MYKHTSKFELNLVGTKKLPTDICSAAIKYRASAVVIDNPIYIPPMLATRISTNGKWKLILAVDFPLGNNYGFSNKFKNLDQSVFACDGFDILLSKRNEVESLNEVKSIIQQCNNINSMIDVRFVIDIFGRGEGVLPALKAIKTNPPRSIKLDHHLALPNVDDDQIDNAVELIKKYAAVPLNLSTNVTLERMNKYEKTFSTFGVDLEAATNIERQLS